MEYGNSCINTKTIIKNEYKYTICNRGDYYMFTQQHQQSGQRRSQSILAGHSEISDHSTGTMVLQKESNDPIYMTHKGSSINVRLNLNGNDTGMSRLAVTI